MNINKLLLFGLLSACIIPINVHGGITYWDEVTENNLKQFIEEKI